MLRLPTLLALCGLLSIAADTALAFDTIGKAGQNREHERITRHALQCGGPQQANGCFQTQSLTDLAGTSNTMGAVGSPDDKVPFTSEAHCDNGDFLDVPGYPNTRAKAQARLEGCREWMVHHMIAAVKAAQPLIDGRKVAVGQIMGVCAFTGAPGRAKCNVLEEFGMALHTAQDFYAHTNWVDTPIPTPTLISPPGLGNTGRSSWIDLRKQSAFPSGLISGCFEGLPEENYCQGHIRHYVLNKDGGQIDPTLGAGKTPRGNVAQNFRHAVEAAIEDTQDKWQFLQERLYIAYGAESGAMMSCALTHDNPEGCTPNIPELCWPAPGPQRAGDQSPRRKPLESRRADLVNQIGQFNARCASVKDGTAADQQCKADQVKLIKTRNDYLSACKSYNTDLVNALR